MEKYELTFTVSGKPTEHTMSRLRQQDCTMIGGTLPQNIDRTRMAKNTTLLARYEIRHNIPEGEGNRKPDKPFRFVDGEKIVFGEIFGESCEVYNRRQKRKDRQKTADTYYDKCRKRWQKSYDKWSALPKGQDKERAYKQIYNYSKEITIRVGDGVENCPTKEQMDMFSRYFFEWFKERYPQMVPFISVVLYDEMVKKTENKQTKWITQAPALHIGFIPVAFNEDGNGMPKVVAWNRCLEQSLNKKDIEYRGYLFSGFRQDCLRGCAKCAKKAGFKLAYIKDFEREEDE